MKLYNTSDIIKLSLKLPDKRETAFVRAEITDVNTNTKSFVSMPHDERGSYRANTTLSVGSYIVIYEVFKDAGFTSPYRIYNDSEEFLRVENINQTTISESDRVIDLMDDSDGRATCF